MLDSTRPTQLPYTLPTDDQMFKMHSIRNEKTIAKTEVRSACNIFIHKLAIWKTLYAFLRVLTGVHFWNK